MQVFIKVPKGTHGAYIAYEAHNELEIDFLLQKGYLYRIIKAEYCREVSELLRKNLNIHGWDGRWFKRAYTDDGDISGAAYFIAKVS